MLNTSHSALGSMIRVTPFLHAPLTTISEICKPSHELCSTIIAQSYGHHGYHDLKDCLKRFLEQMSVCRHRPTELRSF